MHLSGNIGTIRRRWKMSQDEFGALVGVSRNVVMNWERGRSAPGLPVLSILADLCGLAVDALSTRALDTEEIPGMPLSKHNITNGAIADRLDMVIALLTKIANELAFLRGVKD